MDNRTSVILSACIAVFYTLFGGLYSVAYTDVIQLFCIFIGLWMCIPFAWSNDHVKSLSDMEVDWIGTVEPKHQWYYIDYGLLLVFGGIPWQVKYLKFGSDCVLNVIQPLRSTSKEFSQVKQLDEHKFYRMSLLLDAF